MQQVEVLIVGQGMAGTALTTELLEQNITFKVIDDNHNQSSSIMSAGMYNPIVFKRITKSWLANETDYTLTLFCDRLTKMLGNAYHKTTPVARLFTNLAEQNMWLEKMESPLFSEIIDDEILMLPENINKPNGFGVVKTAGEINLAKLLPSFQNMLLDTGKLLVEKFDFLQLVKTDLDWQYKNILAKKVVFCEGFQAIKNPFFNWLPLKPNKGQLLVIRCELLDLKCVVNGGFFIQPLGNHLYRVGATYEWDVTNDAPTANKKEELVEKIKKVLNAEFEVIEHTAGDRKSVV